MAQNSPVICPRCGTRAELGQRFCSECGATLNLNVNKPTEMADGSSYATVPSPTGVTPQQPQLAQRQFPTMPVAPPTPEATLITPQKQPEGGAAGMAGAVSGQFYSETTDANVIPPPPPPDSYISMPQATPQGPQVQQAPQGTPAPAGPAGPASPGTFAPVPSYAQAPKRSRGCLITSIVLLLILAAGATALYFGVIKPHLNNNNGNAQQTTTSQEGSPVVNNSTNITPSGGNTPVSGDTSTPSSGSISTTNGTTSEQLNLVFTYSGINYVINSVEYAQSFSDDASLSAGGVRITFKETNPTSQSIIFTYSDVARLILPDGTTTGPANELHYISPDSQASDTNWLDFQVASQPADLSKLTLEMGLATENQMRIPLSPGANLSQYQPKTSSPNATFTYDGLTWTLTQAMVSYSANGKQATAGNIYMTISLHVVNNSSQSFINLPSSYMRLKAGGTTSAPDSDSTFTDFIAPQTNATGTVTFLAPQGNTSYTLIMLAQQGTPPVQSVSQDFQVS